MAGEQGREYNYCRYYYLHRKSGSKPSVMPKVLSVITYNGRVLVYYAEQFLEISLPSHHCFMNLL